jgi:hypothetical protein
MILPRGLSTVLALVCSFSGCSKKADAPDKAPETKPATGDKPVADKPVADKPAANKPAGEPKAGCSYITEAEATAALAQPSKYRSNDGGANCVIDPVADATMNTISVDFTVKLGDTSDYTYFEKLGKPLARVGDKAVIADEGKSIVQVAAVKGNAALIMTASGAAKTELLVAFANKVFTHL